MCAIRWVCVAEAAGVGTTVVEEVAGNIKLFKCLGLKQQPIPYHHCGIESMQQVLTSTAVYKTGLYDKGWWYMPVSKNDDFPNLPDAIITNGTEILAAQYKSIKDSFHYDATLQHMINYKKTTDFIGLSYLRESEYVKATSYFMDDLIKLNIFQPDLLVTLLNIEGEWDNLSLEQRNDICEALKTQNQHVTNKVFESVNKDIQACVAGGGNISQVYTKSPDLNLKIEVFDEVRLAVPQVGFTTKTFVRSKGLFDYYASLDITSGEV